jgi:hypothetical protein
MFKYFIKFNCSVSWGLSAAPVLGQSTGSDQSPETEKKRFFGSVSVEPTRNRKHEKTDL